MEINRRKDNFSPIIINSKNIKEKDNMRKIKFKLDDEDKLLKICLNDMKKKINFIDKTNWMFKNSFSTHFLET
jgi:hypothetical protein